MKLKKIAASLGVLLCVCAGTNTSVYAETTAPYVDEGISLAYETADNPISDLNIVGTTAYCTSQTDSLNAVSIKVTQTLQKHWGLWIWNDVKGASWSKQVDDSSIFLSNSKSGLENGTYRVKSVFTLTGKNGKKETITVYSSESNVP